jgi:hypothetical protein
MGEKLSRWLHLSANVVCRGERHYYLQLLQVGGLLLKNHGEFR